MVTKFKQTESTRIATINENELMKVEVETMQANLRKADDERDKLRRMLQVGGSS